MAVTTGAYSKCLIEFFFGFRYYLLIGVAGQDTGEHVACLQQDSE